MAILTSTQAGPLFAAATWGGTAPAATGDQLVLNHAVTYDGTAGAVDFGSSAAGNVALQFNAGGSLAYTGAAGTRLTLRYRGDILVYGASLTTARKVIDAGAGALELIADTSAAAAGTSWKCTQGENNVPALLWAGNATAANPNKWYAVKNTSGSGGGVRFGPEGSVDGPSLGFVLPYLQATGFSFFRFTAYDNVPIGLMKLVAPYATFDGCVDLYHPYLGQNADMDFRGATWVNSPNPWNVYPITAQNVGNAQGVRRWDGCVFDKRVSLNVLHGANVDGTRFLGGADCTQAGVTLGSATGVVFRGLAANGNSPVTGALPGDAPLVDTLLWYAGDFDDAHVGGNIRGVNTAKVNAYDGTVLWHDGNSGYAGNSPNGFLSPQEGSARLDLTIRRTLGLPRRNGGAGANLIAAMGNPSATCYLTLEHNTAGSGESMMVQLYGQTAHVAKLRGNLGYRPNGDTSTFYVAGQNQTYDNSTGQVLDPAYADYNAVEGVTPGSSGNGYNIGFAAGTAPGAHDVAVNTTGAQFKWRRVMGATAVCTPLSWVRSLAGNSALTDDQASALLLQKLAARDPAYDWRTVILPWLRDMWAPENPALATAAHDGTTIGAVPYAATVQPTGIALAANAAVLRNGQTFPLAPVVQGPAGVSQAVTYAITPPGGVTIDGTNTATPAAQTTADQIVNVVARPAGSTAYAATCVIVIPALAGAGAGLTAAQQAELDQILAKEVSELTALGALATQLSNTQNALAAVAGDLATVKSTQATAVNDNATKRQALDTWALAGGVVDSTRDENINVTRPDGSAGHQLLRYNAAGRLIIVGPVLAGSV